MSSAIEERHWDWIWEHYSELTPQERRVVSETIAHEFDRTIRALGEAMAHAATAIEALRRVSIPK